MATLEEAYALLFSEYHWTPSQCDQVHPYHILVALGWKPLSSEQAMSLGERARKMVAEKRERDVARNAPRPKYAPKS